MRRVVFRDEVESRWPIAAKGTLDVPDGEAIEHYVGRLVPFTIEVDYGDLPIDEHAEGVVGEPGTGVWYEYRVEHMEGSRHVLPWSGQLMITGRTKRAQIESG